MDERSTDKEMMVFSLHCYLQYFLVKLDFLYEAIIHLSAMGRASDP